MNRVATIRPILDANLAHAIAEWVQPAPRHVLLDLADSDSREEAAAALGELIVARMTMVLPEYVDSGQPPLPLQRESFWSERVLAALPSGHSLAEREIIHWTDLRGERFLLPASDPGPEIRDMLLGRLAVSGMQPDIRMH